MADKKPTFTSPKLEEMQEVTIDNRTKIYIPKGDDPEKAKLRYKNRLLERK